MSRLAYPPALVEAIDALKRFPGIGPKSAERIVLWMLGPGSDSLIGASEALAGLAEGIDHCRICGFFSESGSSCSLCSDPARDHSLLCLVEDASDILPIERSDQFTGLYHVLGGRLSPLDNIGPEQLRISELMVRLDPELQGDAQDSNPVAEIILALSSDVEGEATSNYLGGLLRSRQGIRVTRLAQGLPAGGGLDAADPLTLSRALENRRGLEEKY